MEVEPEVLTTPLRAWAWEAGSEAGVEPLWAGVEEGAVLFAPQAVSRPSARTSARAAVAIFFMTMTLLFSRQSAGTTRPRFPFSQGCRHCSTGRRAAAINPAHDLCKIPVRNVKFPP